MKLAAMLLLLGSVYVGAGVQAHAGGSRATGLLKRATTSGANSYDYQIYVPAKIAKEAKPPVVLFLHGIGQRGAGGYVPTRGAAAEMLRKYMENVPAIVVLPQCRAGSFWSDPAMEAHAIKALDETVAEFGGDPRRLYLIGVSMGGYGAWHLAAQHPGKFAAIVPVCGGSPLRSGDRHTTIARKVGSTPVWVFHGADDRIVPVSESRQMVEALKKVGGGTVRYSEYPGVGHNVWLKTLTEPELLPWLFSQRIS